MTFSNSPMTQNADACRYDSGDDLLILTDFQNVYLPGMPWACPTMEQAIENTLRIINAPDSPDYVITQYLPPVNPAGRWQQYNEEYAQINADEFLNDFPDAVKQLINDKNLIDKNTYSSMKCDAMRYALKGKKRVVLMEAIDLGLEVIYLYDCISGFTPENEKMIRTLAESFSPVHTQVMSSLEYLQLIADKPATVIPAINGDDK